jgi:hypothetical protein
MHKDFSSIATHSYMFRPCWVIFREKLSVVVTLRLHYTVERECAVDCAPVHSQQHILTYSVMEASSV